MNYQPLDVVLRERSRWETIELLKGLDEHSRRERLEGLFLTIASAAHDDTSALSFFELVMIAVDDEELLLYTVADLKTRRPRLEYSIKNSNTVDEARYRATIKRAQTAQRLYSQTRGFEIRRVRHGSEPVIDVRYPILFATRKALLTEIAGGWKIARDEATADRFLQFILDAAEMSAMLYLKGDEGKEEAIFHDVFREVATAGFPVQRLAHAIATFDSGQKQSWWRIMEILTHGWAKLTRSYDLTNAFRVIERLTERVHERSRIDPLASAEVVEYVRTVAGDVQKLDNILLGATLEALDPKREDGVIRVEYSTPSTATIVVFQNGAEDKGEIGNRAAFDNKRDAIRNALAPSRKSMPQYQTRFRYIGTKPWRPNEVIFTIEDTL